MEKKAKKHLPTWQVVLGLGIVLLLSGCIVGDTQNRPNQDTVCSHFYCSFNSPSVLDAFNSFQSLITRL